MSQLYLYSYLCTSYSHTDKFLTKDGISNQIIKNKLDKIDDHMAVGQNYWYNKEAKTQSRQYSVLCYKWQIWACSLSKQWSNMQSCRRFVWPAIICLMLTEWWNALQILMSVFQMVLVKLQVQYKKCKIQITMGSMNHSNTRDVRYSDRDCTERFSLSDKNALFVLLVSHLFCT